MTYEQLMALLRGGARILRAPEGEGAGGGGEGGQGEGAGTGEGEGQPTGGEGEGDGQGAKWWEGDGLTGQQRETLTALGLTVDDPVAAVARLTDMEMAAKKKLGRPADQLMEKPGEGKVLDWMRQNGEMFGIPEAPDKYEVSQPESWPKEAGWDTDFETQARALAHEHGVSQGALAAFTNLYAEKIGATLGAAEQDLQLANSQMMGALEKDFGAQTPARIASAQQAASLVAEAAGLDSAAMQNIAAVLKPKVGDAGTIRLFAAIGDMLGEDTMQGGGETPMGMTPAAARAELAKLQAKGGEWYEATGARDKAAMERLQPKMDQLRKLAAE